MANESLGEMLFNPAENVVPGFATHAPEETFIEAKQYYQNGDKVKSADLLRQILANNADFRPGLELLGRIHMDKQEFDSAVLVHRQLAYYHDDAKANNSLGVSHLMAGENELAKQAFSRCLTLMPTNRTYLANYAKLMIMEENWQSAVMYLEKALANSGNAPVGQLSHLLDQCRQKLGSEMM